MPNAGNTDQTKLLYALPMGLATCAVLYGALPCFIGLSGPTDFSIEEFLRWAVWVYGLVGVVLCYLEDAAHKRLFGGISLAVSVVALFWSFMHRGDAMGQSEGSYPFDATFTVFFLLTCLATAVAVGIHDSRTSGGTRDASPFAKWIVHGLLALWILASVVLLLFASMALG